MSEPRVVVNAPRVVVVGGGLAGLAAGVACADAGARVTLLEERLRLGGATWSTERDGLRIDNGQHVFLRCCTSYVSFLRRLGVEDRVSIQPRLSIPVLSPARTVWLRRNGLPAPLHLAGSILRFTHLSLAERLAAGIGARALAKVDCESREVDAQSFGAWLDAHGQSARSIDSFWDLFARATLNLPARDASLALAAKVFQTGLLTAADAGDIGVAAVPLQELHGEPAGRALADCGAEVMLRTAVTRVESVPGGVRVHHRTGSLEADAVVVASTPEAAAAMLPDEAGVDTAGLERLGASPIVNLHVVYDRPVTEHAFAAGVDTPVQWIFDRTHASGLDRGQYLAISLSAADEWVGISSAALRDRFEPELASLFPRARGARIERFFATCERAATFRQVPGTRAFRPGPLTRVPGVVLAGAWTDTGWPATMEGAVRSGVAAAREALLAAGRTQGLPAAAA